MENIAGFDFFRLESDADGQLVSTAPLVDLKKCIADKKVSDVIFIAHGFRNDAGDATALYKNFLQSFRADLARAEFKSSLGGREIAAVGVYWPSKKFSEGESNDASSDDAGGNTQSIDSTSNDRARVTQQLQALKELAPSAAQALHIDAAIGLLARVENSTNAQDSFVAHILALTPESANDPTEGFREISGLAGSELVQKLSTPIFLPTVQSSARDDGGVMSVSDSNDSALSEGDLSGGAMSAGDSNGSALSIGSFFTSVTGKLGTFLNLTTWYLMKSMAGNVGARGFADALRDFRQTTFDHPVKLHLVGHSLGGRLMTAAAKSLTTTPGTTVNSLTLLEAAFSHYGFSGRIDSDDERGFFREVIDNPVVTGPMIATFSFQDTVVGKAYAISSRLADDNTKAIGDANDKFGGIGHNGAQKTVESTSQKLHLAGTPYNKFALGKVHCLDGSDGLIKDHSDITNADVTYAFASVMSNT